MKHREEETEVLQALQNVAQAFRRLVKELVRRDMMTIEEIAVITGLPLPPPPDPRALPGWITE